MTFMRVMILTVALTVALDKAWAYFRAVPEPTPAPSLEQTAPSPTRVSPPPVAVASGTVTGEVDGETAHSFSLPTFFSVTDDLKAMSQEASLQVRALDKQIPSGGTGVKGFVFSFAHGAIRETEVFLNHVNTRWFKPDGSLNLDGMLELPAGRKEIPAQPPVMLQ